MFGRRKDKRKIEVENLSSENNEEKDSADMPQNANDEQDELEAGSDEEVISEDSCEEAECVAERNGDMDEETAQEQETEQGTEQETLSEAVLEDVEEKDRIIFDLRAEAEERLKEAQENYDKYLRSIAELENYKKRVARERADLIKYAGEHLARDLLDVIDSLERAVSQEVSEANEELIKGIEMILGQFLGILEKHSIKGESALGQQFEPSKEEALTTVVTDEHPEGTVLDELRKAYFFKDKLLRAAQVVVAASPRDFSEQIESEPLEPDEESKDEPEEAECDDAE